MALVQLLYVSSATVPFKEEELVRLLEVSRSRNALAGITGLLLYQGGNFMQILEGPEENVMATHHRITRDQRHKGILTLFKEPITFREFPEWSMAFKHLSSDIAEREGFSHFMNRAWNDGQTVEIGSRARKVLEVFRSRMR